MLISILDTEYPYKDRFEQALLILIVLLIVRPSKVKKSTNYSDSNMDSDIF